MAQGFLQTKIIQGDGDPGDGDALCTNLATFPIGTIYINSESGKSFVRNAASSPGVAADWVSQEGGGGSGLFPTTGTGTATGNVTADLDGNVLEIISGLVSLFSVDYSAISSNSTLRAYNPTGDGNICAFSANVDNVESRSQFIASFNDGVRYALIEASALSTNSALAYTADGHVFIGQEVILNPAAIKMSNLPTSDPGVENQLWNDGGTLKISAG